MTTADLYALAPLLVLTVTIVAQLLIASFGRQHAIVAGVGVVGLVGAAITALSNPALAAPYAVTGLITFDATGLTVLAIATLSAAGVSALAWHRAEVLKRAGLAADPVELHLLISVVAFGAALVSVASHVLTLVLGLEIAAIGYSAAVGWRRDDRESIEGAVKTLVLGAVATSFILFASALAWADASDLSLKAIGAAGLTPSLLLLAGLGIKLGAVPFHGWVTDAWHGASGPVALLLGTTAKAGILAALIHLWPDGGMQTGGVLLVVALASMLGGALLGTTQHRARRMLAASSIAHMGDLLFGVSLGGEAGHHAVLLYLAGYAITLVAVFAALEALIDPAEDDRLETLAGAGTRHPIAASLLTLGVASIAGVPFTAVFAGKLALFEAGANASAWAALGVLAVATVISGSYYLRLLAAVWRHSDENQAVTPRTPLALAALMALAVLVAGLRPDLLAAPIWLFVG